MAFAADFVASETSNVSQILLTDTSTGSDAGLTGRTISLFQTNGSLLTGSTIPWAIADNTITLDVLNKDYSLQILVSWATSAPIGGSTYTKQKLFTSTGNLLAFNFYIIQQLTAQPDIVNNTDYMAALNRLEVEINNAQLAQTYGNQYLAQAALDRGYYLEQYQNYFF